MKKLFKIILYICFLSFCFRQQNVSSNANIKIYNEIYTVLKSNYPLFENRSYYNLDSAYEKYKPEILKSVSEDTLRLYSCRMIETLEDFHVRIFADKCKCFALSIPLHWHQVFYNDSLQKVFWNNSDYTLYQSEFSKLKNNFYDDELPMIRYAKSNKIGYINITRFEVRFGTEFLPKDSNKVAKLMDIVVEEFDGLDAVIIDLRSSMGGWTEYGEIIASRLTKEKRQYSTTVSFKTAKDSSLAIKHFINPNGPKQLNLPIIILTNKVVRSAAEDFILMLKQLPRVYIIGEPTWGAFANSKTHKLSNGWKLQYSTEKVYSPNGQIYEGKGIPVDFRIDNDWDDITSKNDKVLTRALSYIKFNKF